MPHSPSLVVSDLDGTLLRDDKTLSPRTRDALRAAQRAGLRVAIASARPLRLVHEVIGADTDILDALIASNGAVVADGPTGHVRHENRLASDLVATAIAAVREHWSDAGFGWESGEHFAADAIFHRLMTEQRILRDPLGSPETLPAAGVHQLVVAIPGIEPGEVVAPIATALGSEYFVTDSNGGVVEISAAEVTKAEGVRRWAASLGVAMAEVVAFGDDLNDLPMLHAVGRGIAMSNAVATVRAQIHEVAPSNEDDGVATVIETILRQREQEQRTA